MQNTINELLQNWLLNPRNNIAINIRVSFIQKYDVKPSRHQVITVGNFV